MLEVWYNVETDTYTLKEGNNEEILTELAGRFLRECAIFNEKLEKENKQLRAKLKELGVVTY